jgi:hypothetical protein
MKVASSALAGKRSVKGIHPRAAKLLKDKPVQISTMHILRGVQPMRQISMARMMVSMSNYTNVFVRTLLLGTPVDQLVEKNAEKKEMRIPAVEVARIQGELKSLEHDLREIEERYCKNMLELIMIQAYVRKLLQSARIAQYLRISHPDLYLEIEAVAALESL